MGTFQLAIDIRRPPAEVFAFIADPRTMPRWYEAVRQVTRKTPGPVAAGSRYQIVRSLPGGPAYNDVELTEYVPNRSVTLESRQGPTPFRYRYRVEPAGDGTTVTLDAAISSAGLPGPAARLDGLATHLFKRGMTQNLSELKRIVEAGQAGAA